MNCPPSRHPAFIAVACIAMAGAWSTGAFEAELAATQPAAVDRVALLRDAPDCVDVRGTRRAQCIFESTRVPQAHAPEGPAEPQATPLAVAAPVRHKGVVERSFGRVQERSMASPRASNSAAPTSAR